MPWQSQCEAVIRGATQTMAFWKVLLVLCALPAMLRMQEVLDKRVKVGWNISLPCHFSNAVWIESPDGERENDKRVARWLWTPLGTLSRKKELIAMKASGYGLPAVHKTPFKHRIAMNLHAFESGDFSLKIWKVSPSDEGVFFCCLWSPTRQDNASVRMTVLAGGIIPTRRRATTTTTKTTKTTQTTQATQATQAMQATWERHNNASTGEDVVHHSCPLTLPVTLCVVSALVFLGAVTATAVMLKH
ncbi:uncharacterized protein LOC144727677 [Lampetra planeri]